MHDSLCELFLPWEDLSGCDTRSYDEGTCVSVCSNGQTFIAKSLVNGNNDEPWEGSTSSPKTWEVRSMCYWLSYIGVDCGGMTVSQGDAIATCDNLSELQTLLETAIAKKQDQLKAPDGSDLPGGTCVLTCDEINTAFAVINNAKQDKIKTCAGIDMPPGANVPTCAEMGTAITTAINAIPEPTKPMNCAGVEASQFVACEEFVPLLEEALDNCLTVPSLGTICGDVKKVASVVCADDPTKETLVSYSDADITEAVVPYGTQGSGTLTNPFPSDPTDGTTYYSYPEYATDLLADAIDQARLDAGLIVCGTFAADCDARYDIEAIATPFLTQTDEPMGASRMVFSVDGGPLLNTGGGPAPSAVFTSAQGEFVDKTQSFDLTQGVHTICMYITKASDSVSWPFAQVQVGGAPLFIVRRVIT